MNARNGNRRWSAQPHQTPKVQPPEQCTEGCTHTARQHGPVGAIGGGATAIDGGIDDPVKTHEGIQCIVRGVPVIEIVLQYSKIDPIAPGLFMAQLVDEFGDGAAQHDLFGQGQWRRGDGLRCRETFAHGVKAITGGLQMINAFTRMGIPKKRRHRTRHTGDETPYDPARVLSRLLRCGGWVGCCGNLTGRSRGAFLP